MKEAFAIYMSVKKISFYLTDAQILLRSDHKPLEKFLLKNMLNSKVNNWATELEAFNIQFDYIKGSNNILVDTLLQNSLQCIENPIAPQRLKKLQQQDTNIETLKRKLQNNRLDKEYYSLDENELLTRKVIDGGHEFCTIYLLSVLIFQVLQTAHDDLGHNEFPRTYAALK